MDPIEQKIQDGACCHCNFFMVVERAFDSTLEGEGFFLGPPTVRICRKYSTYWLSKKSDFEGYRNPCEDWTEPEGERRSEVISSINGEFDRLCHLFNSYDPFEVDSGDLLHSFISSFCVE